MAARMLEWLEPILAAETTSIQQRAYKIMSNGDQLEPQLAVQLWAQLYGIERIQSLLRRTVRLGEKAASRSPLTI